MAVPTAPISHRLWLGAGSVIVTLTQRSPTFLAPGTDFVEDNFSMDQYGGDDFRMHITLIVFLLLFKLYLFIFISIIIVSALP